MKRVRILGVAMAAMIGTGCEEGTPPGGSSAQKQNESAKGVEAMSPASQSTPEGASGQPAAAQVSEALEANEQAWKGIPGGQEHRFAGLSADVPRTWTIVPQGNLTLLVPPGVNQMVIEEVYGFLGEPTLKSIDAPELDMYLDNALMQLLQVPVQRVGAPEAVKVGALQGKMWKWTATLMDGRSVEARSWGFVGSYATSLVAIATPEAMKRRMGDIEAILGSVRKPAAAAIDASRLVGTWVRAFGSGSVLIGNANEQRITFDPSGRFHYHSEGTSHGLFHRGSSQTDVYGSWKLTGDQLSGTADSGEAKTFTLEARTEAQTGVAVIAIDGTEFRDAQGRRW